jgi:CHAD domain-containing protein
MALLFCKSTFYRPAILLWVFVSFTAQMPDAPRFVSATAAALPPQGVSEKRKADEKTITQIASELEAQVNVDDSGRSLPLTRKQKRNLLKANFEKMKRDAGQLADLAKALQDELDKSNENVLSLDVVEKADKIEKLARKIKGTARGF